MKLFSKNKDSLQRSRFKKKEFLLLLRKLLLRNANISRFHKKPRRVCSVTVSRANNNCILTGRTRAVYKLFKVSRFILKGMGSLGYLPGIRKCSW